MLRGEDENIRKQVSELSYRARTAPRAARRPKAGPATAAALPVGTLLALPLSLPEPEPEVPLGVEAP